MRLAIVLPKVDVAAAGTRIRYARLQAAFEDLGHTLTLNTLDDLIADPALTDDAYLISKIRDVRSVVLAHRLRAAGKHVGIDIFDDYYSHVDDSRFVHVRTWFDQIAPLLTFALTSTARMEMRLERLLPGLPRHRLNDPFTPWDHDSVAKRCAAAAQEARHSRTLRVLWFGIGNNPHFSVGLSDLRNYGHVLRELERAPWRVELTVLTNRRALTADILTRLARIGVATRIEIWSEAREAELLGATTLAFLPVNAQRFSTTKSLNRAVTALTAGAQVLSVGFPLYADLDPFLYRDGDAFLADLEAARLRLRAATLPSAARLRPKRLRLPRFSLPCPSQPRWPMAHSQLSSGVVSSRTSSLRWPAAVASLWRRALRQVSWLMTSGCATKTLSSPPPLPLRCGRSSPMHRGFWTTTPAAALSR